MKYYMMILAIMVALTGCGFDYTPPSNAIYVGDDTLADSQDLNDGETGDEVKLNPPLTNDTDTKPLLADTDVASVDDDSDDTMSNNDGDIEHPLSETDAGADETIPPVETADADSAETDDAPSADTDSNFDSDTAEPKTTDAPDTQDAEAEVVLPCIPNCVNKQCGNDGCDDSCGTCPDGFTCTADFVCECVVGCQIPAEPTTDAADADAGTATTADAKADTLPVIDTVDAIVDAPQGEINPFVDTMVSTESSVDTNVAEIAAETTDDDTVTTAETAPNADTATEAEVGAETGEDTVGEPDTFVQPCLAELALCDDSNACTDDNCDPLAGCGHIYNTAPCNDGDLCTDNDACENSACAPGQPVFCEDSDDCTDDYCQNGIGCVYEWVCECAANTECDDLNPCTNDICASGFCEYTFNSAPCDNNDACTATNKCVAGECLGIAPLNCNDGNECTIDTCNPQNGCKNEPQTGMACNDGNACTTVDSCDKDVCGGEAIVCNDNNPCTDDSCNTQNGCVYTSNNSNPCEDGSLCTTSDFCDAGKCQGGKALKCDDDNICTDNVCQLQKGCVYPANQAGCDDGNGCTVGDICADTACKSGTNICQCANTADCASAEDNNLCNGTLICDKSAVPFKCVVSPNTIIICNASQDTACFKNTCVPATGDCQMKVVNQGGSCNDGNACTSNDQCADGSCAGQSVVCDDSNVCTDDACDPASGCVFTSNKADCDDGSVCTLLDVCQGSKCVGTAPLDCDDSKECTLDICHKTLGCQHSKTAMNGQACDNNDACTVNDTCQNGACQAGTQNTCECYTTADCAGKEDGNFCNGTLVCDTSQMPHKCVLDPATVITCPTISDTLCLKNTCQPSSGKCEMKAVNEGGGCDDGNPCSEADTCQSGACKGSPKPTGTVAFADDFSDGDLAGWKTSCVTNSGPSCSWTCDISVITDPSPHVKIYPLCPAGNASLTSPMIFLPVGGMINFLFSIKTPDCNYAPGACKINAQIGSVNVDMGNVNNIMPNCPAEELKTFFLPTEGTGQVTISCTGMAPGKPGDGNAIYIGEFAVACP